MPQPYTSIIPRNIAWYPSVAAFASTGAVAPIDNSRPRKLWRDNSPYPSVENYWRGFASVQQEKSYRFIARAADGTPLLCPIDSQEFCGTYGLNMAQIAVVNTYREFSFMFSGGVPYLASAAVPAMWADLNMGGFGAPIDYPVDLPTNILLAVENGEVVAYDYQEFLRVAKPPQMGDFERLALIDRIRQAGAPHAEQIKAIRAICTDWHPSTRLT